MDMLVTKIVSCALVLVVLVSGCTPGAPPAEGTVSASLPDTPVPTEPVTATRAASTGQDKVAPVVEQAPEAAGPDAVTAMVAANNGFAFDLFRQVIDASAGENVFISPTSVALALAMTYNGAGGDTASAIAEVLGVEGLDLALVNAANLGFRQSLDTLGGGTELAIANSVWTRDGIVFKEDFLDRNRAYYDALISALDFSRPEAAQTINAWVEEATHGKIVDMVSERIDPMVVMFLINAVYFKGEWKVQFAEERTQEAPFQLADGGEAKAQLMSHHEELLPYFQGDGFQVVSLPYGEDERLSMVIVLPEDTSDLTAWLVDVDERTWVDWTAQLTPHKGNVRLPRFKVEYELTLNQILVAMGMGIAFDPNRADFAGMLTPPPDLHISQVKHKAFVEVNEQGTEAAAATSVAISLMSVSNAFDFSADHPFVYAIQDNETGAILFMGLMLDPS